MEVILHRGVRVVSFLAPNPALISKCFSQTVRCVCCTDPKYLKFDVFEKYPRCRTFSCNIVPFLRPIDSSRGSFKRSVPQNGLAVANFSDTKQPATEKSPEDNAGEKPEGKPQEKVSVFQKMKQLTKDYWYILVPVHLVTSAFWIAICYAAAKYGLDVIKVMEYLDFSEYYLNMVRNSNAGNLAVAYTFYKILTPLRYTVTVGGTTMVIRRLNTLGLLKASSFKMQAKMVEKVKKTVEPKKSTGEHKTEFKSTNKTERQIEPPKT